MADVREGAVEGDSVADVNVEAVFPVGLVDPVTFCQRKRLPLFTVTCITHTHTHSTHDTVSASQTYASRVKHKANYAPSVLHA